MELIIYSALSVEQSQFNRGGHMDNILVLLVGLGLGARFNKEINELAPFTKPPEPVAPPQS